MNASTNSLIVATTPEIEGWTIHEYLGIVSAEAAMSMSLPIRRAAHTVRRRRPWTARIEQRVFETRYRAIALMIQRALQVGAMAIIAASFEYEIIRQPGSGDLLIVTASGTAVTIEQRTASDE